MHFIQNKLVFITSYRKREGSLTCGNNPTQRWQIASTEGNTTFLHKQTGTLAWGLSALC